jgi:nitrogen regulatory protein P-II 2
MQTTTLQLVTIIAEALLQERLVEDLHRLGARGHTITPCSGAGSRSRRVGEILGENIRVEAIVTQPVAERILEFVAEEYFPRFASIAFVLPVSVVRGEKYA